MGKVGAGGMRDIRPSDRQPDRLDRAMAQVLKEARIVSGLTEGQLAARLGGKQQWFHRVERGERRITIALVVAVAAALDISLLTLIDEARKRMQGPVEGGQGRGDVLEQAMQAVRDMDDTMPRQNSRLPEFFKLLRQLPPERHAALIRMARELAKEPVRGGG